MSNTNNLRAFTDVMTLHAWQRPGEGEGTWEIFADVSFGIARVGAEPEIPIRFRLSLKRAEINLILPATDQALAMDPNSIARNERGIGPVQIKAISEQSSEDRRSLEASAGLSGMFGWLGKISLSGKRSKARAEAAKHTRETTRDSFSMTVSGNLVSAGKATWKVEAGISDRLRDSPWDATRARAVVTDADHHTRRGGMEAGGIRFEVICAREDLLIEDLEFKDPGLWQPLIDSRHRKAKESALIQYIRDELRRTGLRAENIEDPYGKLTILDRLIESVDVRTA